METAVKNRIISKIRNKNYKDDSVVYIIQTPDGWNIKKQGFKEIIDIKKTKKEAIDFATNLLQVKQIVIYDNKMNSRKIFL